MLVARTQLPPLAAWPSSGLELPALDLGAVGDQVQRGHRRRRAPGACPQGQRLPDRHARSIVPYLNAGGTVLCISLLVWAILRRAACYREHPAHRRAAPARARP